MHLYDTGWLTQELVEWSGQGQPVRVQWTETAMQRMTVSDVMQHWLREQAPDVQRLAMTHCWLCGGTDALRDEPAFAAPGQHAPVAPCCWRCHEEREGKALAAFRTHLNWRYRTQKALHIPPRHWDDAFWFERGILKQSPLGCALRGDRNGFLAWYQHYLDRGEGSRPPA